MGATTQPSLWHRPCNWQQTLFSDYRLMSGYKLTHLKELEAESIHIIREVVAEFDNPVMLYSVGKDSSVMVDLAMKAFYPGLPPFPLMHVRPASNSRRSSA